MAEWLRRWTWDPKGYSRVVRTLLAAIFHNLYSFSSVENTLKFLATESCDGRVVKALELKSNKIFPRRFEHYWQRFFSICTPPRQCRIYWNFKQSRAVISKWLRRWTWNQMGSSLVGSNPTRSEFSVLDFLLFSRESIETSSNRKMWWPSG